MKARKTTDDMAVLDFIAWFIQQDGYAPTVREVQLACEISSTSVVRHALDRLQADGLIDWTPGLARTMRPTELGLLTVEERARTMEEAR